MYRWFLLAVWSIVGTLGCASSPKLAEQADPPNAHEKQRHAAPLEQSTADSFSLLPSAEQNHVQLVSHTSEIQEESRGLLFDLDTELDELIAFALANNPAIKAVHMEAHALQARIPQVRALDDPMLMTTTFLDPIQTAAGPQDVMLSISQKLPWFGKRALRENVACHEASAAFARIAAAELAVVEAVKLAYYDLYFLDRAIEVNRELESRLEDVIAIATSKYETAGETTGLETVLQAQVELAQLRTVFVQLEQTKAKAKARLAKALHAPRGVAFEIAPAVVETNVPKSADVLIGLIEQCKPQLTSLRRELNRDRSAIALANKGYYPDVTVGFNWHAIGSSGLSAIATGDDAYSLLVGVNLPIYHEKIDAGVREAQFKAARTSQMYDATWDEVRAEVQTLHAQTIEHDRIVDILNDEILPRAEQTLDLSMEAYQVDRITFQQLIDNYKTLLHHRIDYHRRLSQREQSLATLERAVGCAISTWPMETASFP